MINPYDEINWSTVRKTVGTTHDHCTTDAQLTHLKNGGVEFLTVSNYHPSAPFYPYSQQSGITYDMGDIIEARNAEHHNMGGKRADGLNDIGASVHVNSVGSSFSSGNPPEQEPPVGCNLTDWHVVFANIISHFNYLNGGGITLNHPKWTIETRGGCDLNTYMKMLDFSPYVLGIEFFNESCLSYDTGWALDYWDEILSTGRRCWGFAVPDHGCQTKDNWQGRIIYLTDTPTQETLLKALREGSFYSQINNTDLAFTGFDYNKQSGVLTVSTNNAQYLNVVVDGEYTRIDSSGVTFDVPKNAKYVRVEAHTSEDSIYSNPIMLTDSKKVRTGETLILMY